jgi:hypothetical protein
MPAEQFERIISLKSEQNSSHDELQNANTQLGGTDQRTQFRYHCSRLVRFSDKATVRRELGGLHPHLPRYNENFYGGPAVANCVG